MGYFQLILHAHTIIYKVKKKIAEPQSNNICQSAILRGITCKDMNGIQCSETPIFTDGLKIKFKLHFVLVEYKIGKIQNY